MRCTNALEILPLAIDALRGTEADTSNMDVKKLLTSLSHCVIFTQEGGFLAMYPIDSYWDAGLTLAQMILYTDPAYQKQGIAKRLIEEAKAYAKDIGATPIFHGPKGLMEKCGLTEHYTNYRE